MSAQLKQAQFMKLMEQEMGYLADTLNPAIKVPATARLYINLCQEELEELFTGFQNLEDAEYEDETRDAIRELVDDAADLLYVLCGFCNSLGIPLDSAFDEAHSANMRKAQAGDDGFKIIRRDDGKILKPEGWEPPNIDKVIDLALIQESFIS